MIRQPFKARASEELMALLSAMATAVLAVIIVTMRTSLAALKDSRLPAITAA